MLRSVLEKCPAIPLKDKDRQKEQEGEESEVIEAFNFDLLPSDLSVSVYPFKCSFITRSMLHLVHVHIIEGVRTTLE